MFTSCNPGRWLEANGSFEFEPALSAAADPRGVVRDRESGSEVTLAGLLASFMEDPTDTVTGPIRITIQAG